MALNTYQRTTWEDADSTATPIDAQNLNHIEDGIYNVTEKVKDLETDVPAKATNAEITSEADTGYVTPKLVGQIVDRIFGEQKALKYSGGKLVYTDADGNEHIIT